MSDTFRVTYVLTIAKGENPADRIKALQLEQSVELPDAVVRTLGVEHVKGTVSAQEYLDDRQLKVTIEWPQSNHGGEITQLLNLLFGNISMKQGIVITGIFWEDLNPGLLEGPAWGIGRIRKEWGIADRALGCTALKPMGFRTRQLADLTYRFALGGIDIIKDDHGLAEQPTAPFHERVKACVQAIDRAAQKSGRRSRYFPNITTDPQNVPDRYEMAAELGADGVLLVPMLTGPALMHHLARSPIDLPIMAHPAFSGTLIARESGTSLSPHGFDAGLFYGALSRALGADFVIYPNTGGRFSFQPDTCEAINRNARRADLPFASCFPAPGGGMQRDKLEHWLRTYGIDTAFLIGGNLYEQPDEMESASRAFMKCITDTL